MAKPKFDPNAFKSAKEAAGNGEFPEIETGIYIVELMKATEGEAKSSGRYQVSLGYQIDENDPNFKNQYIWEHIGLADSNGVINENGYKALAIRFNNLKIKFDPATDELATVLENAIGTKVRLQYTKADSPEGFDKVRIKSCISTPQAKQPTAKENQPDIDDLDAATQSDEPQIELLPGMWIETLSGKKYRIINVLDVTESEDGNQYIQCIPQGGKAPKDMVTLNCDEFKEIVADPTAGATPPAAKQEPAKTPPVNRELDEIEEAEEQEEVEEAPQMTVGANAKGTSSVTGKTIQGTIRAIEGEIVKIGDGKQVARCKKDTVVLL